MTLDSRFELTSMEEVTNSPEVESTVSWGDPAPKGGKAVLSRILKDGAKVPLFFGQTLVNSLRDMGYNSTTSALCEHVDNAIQWGATEIRVYFHESGRQDERRISALVCDNARGMAPNVLKVATAFGGSLVFENRGGIGRYGMGMKAAALSMSPAFEVYSWQEPRSYYSMILDVEEIGNSRSNSIELPDPTLNENLPSEIVNILTRHMAFPKNPSETQTLLTQNGDDLAQRLGRSGTIVYMPECDRLTYRKVATLVDHATKEMGRIYRRWISKGFKLYVNNRLVEAFDPTYSMPSARHTRIDGLSPTQSRLVRSWRIEVPVAEGARATTFVHARLYVLPYEHWGSLPRKVLKNDLHIFDDHTVSFVRNDREVEIGSSYRPLKIRKHGDFNWLRLEIEFTADADDGFGIAANKQGVRLKEYVAERIVDEITTEIASVREHIKKLQAERASLKSGSSISEAERRATDAEGLQGKPLPELPEDERAALDQNLRALAVTLKREDETDEQAFQRIRDSRFLTVLKHDEFWPFYHCDFRYGKVILTLNTAHPFFQTVWQPLSQLARTAAAAQESSEDESVEVPSDVAQTSSAVLVGLQSVLLTLARTQSRLGSHDMDSEYKTMFDTMNREWSENLATVLLAK
jgi:Histidine kinase-, DNA gyrase B-, and HSP90-like ATPase